MIVIIKVKSPKQFMKSFDLTHFQEKKKKKKVLICILASVFPVWLCFPTMPGFCSYSSTLKV